MMGIKILNFKDVILYILLLTFVFNVQGQIQKTIVSDCEIITFKNNDIDISLLIYPSFKNLFDSSQQKNNICSRCKTSIYLLLKKENIGLSDIKTNCNFDNEFLINFKKRIRVFIISGEIPIEGYEISIPIKMNNLEGNVSN